MLIRTCVLIAVSFAPIFPAKAQREAVPLADVGFQVIDEDGRTIEDCYVANFIDRNDVNLVSRFHDLHASGVAYGLYRYVVKQRGAWPGSVEGRAAVSAPQVLVVVPVRRSELRGAIAETVVPPGYQIVGKLKPWPSPEGREPIRVHLVAVYGAYGPAQLDVKVDATGEFRIYTPLVGRYLVAVIRGDQVLGLQQVSFEENWQPATFTITLADALPSILRVTGSRTP